MKFLAVGHYRDSWYAIPPRKQADITASTSTFVEKQRKSGKLKDMYALGTLRGAVSIWDFANEEEMGRVFRESPMFAFLDVELTPIMDVDTAGKINAASTKAATKTAKK
jgi:muconolactone delta-isomerase